MKKSLKLLVDNNDPHYLREKLHEAFPELSAGDKLGAVFKFWQLRENRTELIALPVDVNNAQALVNYMELNRSCVYIKAEVSLIGCLVLTSITLSQCTTCLTENNRRLTVDTGRARSERQKLKCELWYTWQRGSGTVFCNQQR